MATANLPACPYARAAALLEVYDRQDAIRRELHSLSQKALRLMEELDALDSDVRRLKLTPA